MKEYALLLKPASGLCNMRCGYCFYADEMSLRESSSRGLMTEETARAILLSLKEDLVPGDSLHLAFQGGEPTLSGIAFYKAFFQMAAEILKGISVSWSFQTNGLLLDEEWCRFFRENRVLVGLSIDGPARFHNAYRKDASGESTSVRVHGAMELLKQHGVAFNVLTVLTPETAARPEAVWNWVLREEIRYVQFIPCLGALDLSDVPKDSGSASERARWALTPSAFRDFYLALFPLWKKSLEEGHAVSVKFFDDLVNLFLYGRETACGMTGQCSVQYVAEADGLVYPCDFYALDKYRMGDLKSDNLLSLRDAAAAFLNEPRACLSEEPCRSCPLLSSCRGGCKRMKDTMYLENGSCRYRELLDRILDPLIRTAESFRRQRP